MKKFLILLLTAFLWLSCKDLKQQDRTANDKLVEAYFVHFNNHDWQKMAAMYADTAEFRDPGLGKGIVKQSRQQTIEKYTQLEKMFPDVNDHLIRIYPSGEQYVIVEFISSGTAPDGSRFELPICTIFTINKGLITKDFTYYNNFDEQEPK